MVFRKKMWNICSKATQNSSRCIFRVRHQEPGNFIAQQTRQCACCAFDILEPMDVTLPLQYYIITWHYMILLHLSLFIMLNCFFPLPWWHEWLTMGVPGNCWAWRFLNFNGQSHTTRQLDLAYSDWISNSSQIWFFSWCLMIQLWWKPAS